jgi:flagellar motor switch protein FliN
MSTSESQPDFFDSFFDALLAAMTDACGQPWLATVVSDVEPVPEDEEPVHFALAWDGSVEGSCTLTFRRGEALALAAKCQHQEAAEFGTEQADVLRRLIDEAGAAVCVSLAAHYGAFTLRTTPASEAPSEDRTALEKTATDDQGLRISFKFLVSSALLESLSRAAIPATIVEEAPLSTPEARNLDLVMDVELNVTLRFGQRQLALREVMELTSGSVIELDRQVEEPVELLLEGKVIAKGEAVVIDGNYGLRVTEVPQNGPAPLRR